MKIKILQWNIWYDEKAENAISLIKEIDPDIVCLQELSKNYISNDYRDIVEIMKNSMGMYSHCAKADTYEGGFSFYNGIFSKYEIIESGGFFIQQPNEGTDDFSKQGRVCATVKVKLNHDTYFDIATTHSSYVHRFEDSIEKQDEINKLIDYLKTKKENFIFTGDLNTPPDSKYISMIEEQLKNCGPDYAENTWTTKPFSYNGFEENKLNWRLDYVFGSKDIKVISSKVIQTEYSDHLPILVEIEV